MIPLALVGVATLSSFALTALFGVTKYWLLPRRDLHSRYGKGWAIVTGATDGLGKQYAFELAKEKFHIILVGRDEEKLKAVAKEIQERFNWMSFTKIVVFDFATLATPESV
jgi:17beta-estradiol 17-dehydrogenase / very-long-chain 3-oxoacyl-CoA reductase